MGSTNKTAHYELPQFGANDKPSWLGDVNEAMEAIDTGIYGAKSSADGAQQTANNAVAGVQSAGTRMDGMQTQLDTVATQANQTATTVAGHTSAISTNSANINVLNSRLGSTDISDIGDGSVTGAIASLAGGGGASGNVRWNEETDYIEVLKNGVWTQTALNAGVNAINVLKDGVFNAGVQNGVYDANSTTAALTNGGHNQFTITGGVAKPRGTDTSASTFVFEFNATGRSTIKIVKADNSEVTMNIASLSGTQYLGIVGIVTQAGVSTSEMTAYVNSSAQNFGSGASVSTAVYSNVVYTALGVKEVVIQ